MIFFFFFAYFSFGTTEQMDKEMSETPDRMVQQTIVFMLFDMFVGESN